MKTKYKLKYIFSSESNNGEGFEREEIIKAADENPNIGACDTYMFISIINHDCGSKSMNWFSGDVKNKEECSISNEDLFTVWAFLGKQIAERDGKDWQKEIAEKAYCAAQEVMLAEDSGSENTINAWEVL